MHITLYYCSHYPYYIYYFSYYLDFVIQFLNGLKHKKNCFRSGEVISQLLVQFNTVQNVRVSSTPLHDSM